MLLLIRTARIRLLTHPLHYASATYSDTSGFTRVNGVSADTQFGTYTMSVVAPISLLLPASKGLSGFVPPIEGEHFQCYRLNNASGPAPQNVSVSDQFVTGLIVDVNVAWTASPLCLSAEEWRGRRLLITHCCVYVPRTIALPFGEVDAFLTTQFGQKKVTAVQYDELCVPATVTVP